MLISEALNQALNEQVGHEFSNAQQYLAIAAYFERESLFGLAKIYYKQAEEEREHGMKLLKFVLDAGGTPNLPAIAAPKNDFGSAEEAAKLALDSEKRTTDQIYSLVTQATAEKSYIALNFLQWFVNEQLEEVSSAESRLALIRRAGPSLMMMEAYLAHLSQV